MAPIRLATARAGVISPSSLLTPQLSPDILAKKQTDNWGSPAASEAIHGVPDPRAGFVALAAKVRSGGHISAWVYGAENNEWITRWIDPLRKNITSRINPRALLQLSKLPAAILYATNKTIYGPLNRSPQGRRYARRLFYNDYMKAISVFDWREHHAIVFDHLVAPTAFYIPREEFEAWWRDVGATEVVIGWHNQNSWRGFGKVG